ncbi:hypothetical protein L1987_24645 [Smallanthus sonchifolius]|uniref:Uncharacterized protein n=1 Tax=Smallanthus sonchifolius TaxID=185202 RepID=A0ACB9IKT1_9ASTR|nr:hypothetical protein L1987_24645 [Smallanthus sonchifolius]
MLSLYEGGGKEGEEDHSVFSMNYVSNILWSSWQLDSLSHQCFLHSLMPVYALVMQEFQCHLPTLMEHLSGIGTWFTFKSHHCVKYLSILDKHFTKPQCNRLDKHFAER